MATRTRHEDANVGTRSQGVTGAVPEDHRLIGPRLTSEQVWHALAKASFAVLGYVTPSGEPRSSGVLYKKELGSLVPAERRASGSIVEILPQGEFLTYALGVPLRKMLDLAAARARVSATQEGRTR